MLLGLRVDLDPFVLCQGAHERTHEAFSRSSVTRDHWLLREETIFWWRNNSYSSQQSFLWSTGYIHLLTEETILSWVPTAQFQMVLHLFNPSSGPLGRFQCSHLTGSVDSENRSDTPESRSWEMVELEFEPQWTFPVFLYPWFFSWQRLARFQYYLSGLAFMQKET